MVSRPVLFAAAARDPFVAQLVQLLRSEGREVMVARRAETVFKMATAKRRPAAIVIDTVLSDSDGLVLCRRLKENPATGDIPVFCFSVVMARDRCLEAGADDFMMKPLEQDLLLERVRDILDSRVTPLPQRIR
jgi:DNA-binding response OmpR family regulator